MSDTKIDSVTKKIIEIYKNYGLDTSNMSEEEFERIKELYLVMNADVDGDLIKSKKFTTIFSDDIL